MLNCSDIDCILHHHHYYQHLHHLQQMQLHLQDHREHHAMSGETDDFGELPTNLNETGDSDISGLSHLDAPSESVYILCGVVIAMVLVAVIIVLLAVFISKLRKRDDNTRNNVQHRQDHVILHSAQNINNNNNSLQCHHNNINANSMTATTPPAVANGGTTIPTVSSTVVYPPPPPPFMSVLSADQATATPRQFIWQIPATHPYAMYNNDKETLVQLPTEQPGYCQGWRKNLKGRWRRLIKKKPSDQQYGIPPELREQLKTIYVY